MQCPVTFQNCIMAACFDFIENIMELFMDDFSMYGVTFNHWLNSLSEILRRCEDMYLVLN